MSESSTTESSIDVSESALDDMTNQLMGMITGMRTKNIFESDPPLSRGSNYSAGYDIPSRVNATIPPKTTVLIKTGVRVKLPEGFYLQLQTKSRHTINGGMVIIDGTHVPLSEAKKGKSGDEVAQMMSGCTVYSKHQVTVEGGVIDPDYYHEIHVALHNHSETEPFIVKAGDAVAQGILLKHYTFTSEQSEANERSGGFGSTN